MMRSIFGENLFDDFFGNDLDLFPALPGSKALYGKHAKNLMKTDVRRPKTAMSWISTCPVSRRTRSPWS